MPPAAPGYNERAWAIDVITEINAYCGSLARPIRRAGGEYTVAGVSGSLFPDVLLFGDSGGSIVQQGWELKMPDTLITDSELLDNAEAKARRLGLDSFVVWNANEAALYCKNPDDQFELKKAWPKSGLNKRPAVRAGKAKWSASLRQMLDEINDLFDSGGVVGAKPTLALGPNLFVSVLDTHSHSLATHLEANYKKNATFAALVDEWWALNDIEHPDLTKFDGLARVNIVSWLNRFLFAHYLKRFNSAAKSVESIVKTTSISDAISIFDKITSKCNFLNVFHAQTGQQYIDKGTWGALIAYNVFLVDFRLETVPQEGLQNILESALDYGRKKLAGQFATPRALSDYLVKISVENREASVLDPCSGTGTIARAVYDLKRAVGLTPKDALKSTWASDKFAFPLQLCSIALSDPAAQGEVVQVFQYDVFELAPGLTLTFTDPTDGHAIQRVFASVHAVVSNLPFVRFEDVAKINPLVTKCRETIAEELGPDLELGSKSDLYAYLVLHLGHLLEEGGYLGVVVSNSWLGTDWGVRFRAALLCRYRIVRIVISGRGRWFRNADVVTTLLILQKTTAAPAEGAAKPVEFVVTNHEIESWQTVPGRIEEMVRATRLSTVATSPVSKASYSLEQIQSLEGLGVGWSAYFSDLTWVPSIAPALISVNTLFDVARGERRGWDDLFFPAEGHKIEPEFLQPVLLTARTVAGLVAVPDGEAFCCSMDQASLKKGGKVGAIRWIKKFQTATNEKGKPLPEVLERAGYHWYEMRPNTLADLAVTMNPDKRLCVIRLKKRAFVNQRLIRFTKHDGQKFDIELCHSLLNSVLGMFLLEAAGFGRGLGALDLNATKLERNLHMLNPVALSSAQGAAIKAAFRPLLGRDVLDLPDELAASDRHHFDDTVLTAFGVGAARTKIHASLLRLFEIRQTART